MSLVLSLRFYGMEGILDKLKKIEQNIKNDRAMFTKMAVWAFKDVQDHFQKESGSSGRWPSLSQATIKSRRQGKKAGRSPRMLQDTGRLKNSLLPTTGKTRFIPDGVILYTDLVYASAHNFGTDKIPQREFMWLSNEAKRQIIEVVRKHVMHGP